MKFFLFTKPYEALVLANDNKQAVDIFAKEVADVDEAEFVEATTLEAREQLIQTLSESASDDMLKQKKPGVLLIDASLY